MKKRILVVRFGSLGDVILTSAAVLNLRLGNPGCHLVFLTKERFRPIAQCIPGVDEVIGLPEQASVSDLTRLLLQLDELGFDLIVDLHGNLRSWLIRRLVSAGDSLVYHKRRLERMSIVRSGAALSEEYPHTIDLYNEAVRRSGSAVFSRRPQISIPDLPSDMAVWFRDERPTVVVAPGAAHGNKQWPIERFARTAEILHEVKGARIVWAVTADDAGRSGLGSRLPATAFVELVDRSAPQLAAIIARSRVTVCNDSGLSHLSSAVGTPAIAIFGPTHPALGFSPRGLHDRVIQVDEHCRPCSLHGRTPCYRSERYCFTRISAEDVAEEVAEVIEARELDRPALIVDRDGTVMVDKDYLSDPEQVELIAGSAEALRKARAAGFRIVIVSNQSGIARGLHSREMVESVNHRLLDTLSAQGVEVDALYYCPHHHQMGIVPEYTIECDCRKPGPGMAEKAALQFGLDLRRSIVIGDSGVDFDLGRVIGGRSYLVRTGYGKEYERKLREAEILGDDDVADDLSAAVDRIVAGQRLSPDG
jgi:histidinol-phosphate phosphatase family protein